MIQKVASWSGSGESGGRQDGTLSVTLLNVGLGPALNAEVTASYNDGEHEPAITPNPYVVPAIRPGEDVGIGITTAFGSSPKAGILPGQFSLSGTYTDRSRLNTYAIITDWSA